MAMRVTHREIGNIPGCKQPAHVPSLCEQLGIPLEPSHLIAERYSSAIQGYVKGEISEHAMLRVISAKACLPDRT